jgi:hypothetical protein
MVVVSLSVAAFTPSAHAQTSSPARHGKVSAINSGTRHVAGLNHQKHGNQLSQRKYAKQRTGARTDAPGQKKHRARGVEPKTNVESILLRLAPYDFALA